MLERLIDQENTLKKIRKLKPFYDFEIIMKEITTENFWTRFSKHNNRFSSSFKLPLSSRSSFSRLLLEKQRNQLKSFASYSSIVAKKLSHKYFPTIQNQNFIEKRHANKKVYPEISKKIEKKNHGFLEDNNTSSLSMESKIEKIPKKGKTKSVYFGSKFSHQTSNASQISRSPTRKSLFSRKKERKINIFIDCFGKEHSYDEIKLLINSAIENKQNFNEEEIHENYLKIRVKKF